MKLKIFMKLLKMNIYPLAKELQPFVIILNANYWKFINENSSFEQTYSKMKWNGHIRLGNSISRTTNLVEACISAQLSHRDNPPQC